MLLRGNTPDLPGPDAAQVLPLPLGERTGAASPQGLHSLEGCGIREAAHVDAHWISQLLSPSVGGRRYRVFGSELGMLRLDQRGGSHWGDTAVGGLGSTSVRDHFDALRTW